MTNKLKFSKGFTLVELSIVIIIVGFLIAGISAGQSLIKQAALNSVITDFSNYGIAMRTFKNIYNYYPGDHPNASSYWAGAHDGNGDGIVYPWSGDRLEPLSAWNQLSLAHMVQGNWPAASSPATVGVDFPGSKYSSAAGFNFDAAVLHDRPIETVIQFGTMAGDPVDNYGPAISSQDASNVDRKMDDGNPATGTLFTIRGSQYDADGTKCVDQPYWSSAGTPVNFLFEDTIASCRMWYTAGN